MDAKKECLSNRFFRENPLMDLSAAMMAYSAITMGQSEELNQMVSDIAEKEMDEERKEKIRQERRSIQQTDDPAALVEIMRKGHDTLNRRLLCAKVLALQEQTMPLLLRRYRTCTLDHFIDDAIIVFSTCERKYAEMLREMYADIRCPFAQACACLAFGMQRMENEIPFLHSEYLRFQKDYPDETFHQHPLLALYLLHGRM